jgi:hypothetical protein
MIRKSSRPEIIGLGMRTGINRCGLALMLGLLGELIIPTTLWAQAGYYIIPSLSVAEVYDDNIFSTFSQGKREADLISRFSPGIRLGYQSTPLTLLGHYTFDSEVYADHPELSAVQARQRAAFELRYLPIPLLTLSFTSNYIDTPTSREINTQTGLEGGRVRAQQYSLNLSVAYRFAPLITGTGGYSFTKDEQSGAVSIDTRTVDEPSGGVTTDTHTVNWGLNRRITPLDTGSLGYSFTLFRFEGEGTTTSQAFTVGWARQLTALTSVELRAGPRFSEGSVTPDLLASIRHRLKLGQVSVTYSRSQYAVAGQAGTVNTDSFVGAFSYQLLPLLEVSAAPTFYRNTRGRSEAKVYGMGLNAAYQINKRLSLQSSYTFIFQQGVLDSTTTEVARGDENIYHNIFSLSLVVTYPYRID